MDIRTASLEEMEGPLKLIDIKPDPDPCKNFTLELQSDVLKKVLSSCGNRRICVLSVVGALRTGKTFLLNFIKAYLESVEKGEVENWMPRDQPVTGFQWSHGYNPVTKGLWVWSRAFLINDEEEELAVLLVDTEGIDEELPNNDLASTIVGLSLLCSSTTIFNISYEFNDSTFELLEPVCKYGKTHAKKCDSPAFGKLSFLIRDWAKPSSVLSNPFNDDAGERLKRQKLSNEMHPNLSKSFTKVEFAVLPNIGEKARKIDFDGRMTQMNIDFSKRFRSYICKIANPRKLACNRIFNNDIRASQFTSLLQGYVQLFNNVSNAKDFPQQIWATAVKAAIHSKTEDGLATYEKYFPLRNPNANGEYINPDKVDGFNIFAKPEAKKAFDQFKMPVTESQNIEKIIDVALENHLASFKQSNSKKRQAYIAQQENKTIERFRLLMLQKFDKILHRGGLQNNQYYDPEIMKLDLDIFKDEALESFRQLLSQEPDDIRQKIVSNTKTKICSIMQDHIDLNKENQERAKVQADQIVIQLVLQYSQSIGDLLDKAKGQISVHVLEMLHVQKLEEIKRQFEKIDFPGDSNLKEGCWNTFCMKTQSEFEKFSKLLEEAADDFDFKIQTESANHRRALVEKLDSLEDYDSEVFLNYHKELSKQITDRLTNECSYAPNSTQRKAWLQTVTALLENTYHNVIKDDIVTNEILQKKAKHLAEISFQRYQGEMNFYLDNFEKPVEDTEFESIHSTCQETAVSEFLSKIDSVNEMKIIFRNEYKDILSEDIREKYETYKQQNQQAFSIAKTNAEIAYSQCVDDLESKILRATEEVNMLDELDQAFNEAKQKAFVEFRQKFPTKNESLQNTFIHRLQSKANEFHENAKLSLQSKMETFMVALKLAQNKVERFYNSEMTRNFETNRNAPFTEEQLLEIHNQAKQQAISQANNATQLNPAQQEKIDEYLESLLKTWKEKNEVNKMSYSGEPAIGIDFGTTHCCAAVYYQGKLQNIPNSNAENTTPSYVTLDENGSWKCIGDISKQEAYLYPSHTIYDIKRILGRRMNDKSLKDCIRHFPFSVVEHEGVPKISAGSTMISPESISGMVLVQIKNDAEAYLNKQVNKAVITVPPDFSDIQRQATKAAAESAGFQVLGILNEPSAAALACVDKIDFSGSTKKILVYDLGGGTLDVTVLEMSQRQINVLGVKGDAQLGGDYIDRNLTKYCAAQFKAKTNIDLFKMLKSDVTTEAHDARSKLRRLLTFCEKAKCILTSATTTTITIDGFHEGNDFLVEVSRRKFEELNERLFRKTIHVVNRTLMSAGVRNEDIDEVILVGGSTRIPKLRQLVIENFNGKPLHFSDNADVVVAHGAAMQAAILNTKPDQEVFDFE